MQHAPAGEQGVSTQHNQLPFSTVRAADNKAPLLSTEQGKQSVAAIKDLHRGDDLIETLVDPVLHLFRDTNF